MILAEKYRPKEIFDLIMPDKVEALINNIIETEEMPNLLLSGNAGVGKTTLAMTLVSELNADFIKLNASDDNSVDVMRNRIKEFIMHKSILNTFKYKVVILDEADYLSQGAQAILRGFMEEYTNRVRFILTCNYEYKIIDPIKSRCTNVYMDALPKWKIINRIMSILIDENIDLSSERVKEIVDNNYPDIRRMLNSIQTISSTGNEDDEFIDLNTEIYDLLIHRKLKTARETWISNNLNVFNLLKYIWDNIMYSNFSNKPELLISLANTQYEMSVSKMPEIAFTGGMIKLIKLLKVK